MRHIRVTKRAGREFSFEVRFTLEKTTVRIRLNHKLIVIGRNENLGLGAVVNPPDPLSTRLKKGVRARLEGVIDWAKSEMDIDQGDD